MCGRCWRELLATEAGPFAAAADPYAPRWVLRLVVAGGAPELLQAVAARGATQLPRQIRRRIRSAGFSVAPGRGTVEVARWARVSQHGHGGLPPWAFVVGATAISGAAVAAVLVRSNGDGSQASMTTPTTMTSTLESSSSMVDAYSTVPATTISPASSTTTDAIDHVVSPTTRATTPSTTTTPPMTTAAPAVKTVSVILGAGCTRVAYEATKGVTAVVLLEDGTQVASGVTSAEWSGTPSTGATWSARLTVSGAWSGAFQWEGC